MGAATRVTQEFDPSSASGKRWLDKMANKMKTTGTKCQHISNNAPRDICEPDVEKRKTGIAVAKKWLDGAKMLGAKSMRVNSGGPRIAPARGGDGGLPEGDELAKYLRTASRASRRWRTTAARWASRSLWRTTGD